MLKNKPLTRFAFFAALPFLVFGAVGCGKKTSSGENQIEGVSKYHFQVENGHAVLSVSFKDMHADAGARIPLQRPAGAYIEVGPDFESGGTLFVISTPLSSLWDNQGLPLVGLPDGRPIHGVVSGSLQGTAANIPVFGLTYLYMGNDVFGIFIPANLGNLPVTVTVRMRDEMGNLLGVMSGIPRGQTGKISGLLFLFPMDGGSSQNYIKQIL